MGGSGSLSVAVIGGGLGGLGGGLRRARRAAARSLFSRRTHGLAARPRCSAKAAFRFDMGPTIVTIPSRAAPHLRRGRARLDDYLDLVRLDPQWRCFFDDGSRLDLAQNLDAMAQTLDALRARHRLRRRLPRLHRLCAAAHRISDALLLLKPIGGSARHVRLEGASTRRCSATCSRCGWAARSRARCANSRPTRASRR